MKNPVHNKLATFILMNYIKYCFFEFQFKKFISKIKTINNNQTKLHYNSIHHIQISNQIAIIEQKGKIKGFQLQIDKQLKQNINVYILFLQILNIYCPVSLGNERIIATINN